MSHVNEEIAIESEQLSPLTLSSSGSDDEKNANSAKEVDKTKHVHDDVVIISDEHSSKPTADQVIEELKLDDKLASILRNKFCPLDPILYIIFADAFGDCQPEPGVPSNIRTNIHHLHQAFQRTFARLRAKVPTFHVQCYSEAFYIFDDVDHLRLVRHLMHKEAPWAFYSPNFDITVGGWRLQRQQTIVSRVYEPRIEQAWGPKGEFLKNTVRIYQETHHVQFFKLA